MTPFRLRVRVASLKTLYALVQIRAAWRECLAPEPSPKVTSVPATPTDEGR